MADLELTVRSLRDSKKEVFELVELLLDNKVTAGKTKMTALKARIDALNTAIQASSNFHNLT